MSEANRSFEYSVLGQGEIRLLYLTSQGSGVEWSLKTVQLDPTAHCSASIAYEALSYTWGDLSHTYPFRCNGQVLQIHHNLKEALPFLARRATSSLPIWIDALCINQSDSAEKKIQIGMMDKIYRSASQVLVWLGPASEYTQQAIEVVRAIPGAARMVREKSHSWKNVYRRPEDLELPPLTEPVWNAVYFLLYNPWFRRLWIVQEMALAQKIIFVCGDLKMEQMIIVEALNCALQLRHVGELRGLRFRANEAVNYQSVFLIRNVQHGESPGDPDQSEPLKIMRIILLMAGNHHCYEARDRILGLLGFFSDDNPARDQLLNANSVVDAYTKFTGYLFETVSPMHPQWWQLLHLASRHPRLNTLPSWVPDFHQLDRNSNGWTIPMQAHMTSNASVRPNIVTIGPPLGQLSLKGRLFDLVTIIHPKMPNIRPGSAYTSMKSFIKIHDWEKSLAQMVLGPDHVLPSHLLSEPSEDPAGTHANLNRYWCTLVGGDTHPREGVVFTYHAFREFRIGLEAWASVNHKYQLLERLENGESVGDLTLTDREEHEFNLIGSDTIGGEFLGRCSQMLEGRELFNSEGQRFGFGAQGIRPGDCLCVFNSAPTAHIIRRVEGNENLFTLIGEAYVHGMMDNEIEEMEIEERDIILT